MKLTNLQQMRIIDITRNSSVYLVERHRKSYALKVCKKNWHTDIEIHFLSSHQHENMSKLLDIEHESNNIYMLFKCMCGDLQKFIALYKKIDNQIIHYIILQLVNVIAYLQKEHIAHCDIKPENILIDDHYHIELTDFGNVHFLSNNGKIHNIYGTRSYLAPEVLTGLYDERVDLWGLGLICLILFAGYNPYDSTHSHKPFDFCKIPKQPRNFIRHLLLPVNERMTIEEVLDHPYIKNYKIETFKRLYE